MPCIRCRGPGLARLLKRVFDSKEVSHGIGRIPAFGGPLVAVHLFRPAEVQRGEADDRQCLCKTRVGFRTAVVIAPLPVRIEFNRRCPDVGELKHVGVYIEARTDDMHHALDEPGVLGRPLHCLKRSGGSASRCDQLFHSEGIDKLLVHAHEISDRNHGKARAVRLAGVGVDGRGAGRSHHRALDVQVDKRVGADDEVFVGIDRLPRADDGVPVAGRLFIRLVAARGVRGAGEEMRDEDRVVAAAVQLAVSLVADAHVLDGLAAHRGVLGQREELLLGQQLRECIAGDEQRGGRRQAETVSHDFSLVEDQVSFSDTGTSGASARLCTKRAKKMPTS